MITTEKQQRRLVNQRGMTLVIVLWIVTLLAVMAGSFAYSMRVETQLATHTVGRAQARTLAEAGVAYALAWQMDPEAQKRWLPNGDPHEWLFGSGRLRIETTSANGLVSLNTADAELLKILLKTAGVDAGDQDRVAEAILNWRGNPGAQTTLSDAESASSGMKGAPFESIEELGQIPGIHREVYARMAGVVTAYSYHYGVNPEFAPDRVLQALGFDEQAIVDYVQARARAAVEGSPIPPLPSLENHLLVFSQSRSNVYHVAVAAETESGVTATVEAVFDTQNGATGQVRELAWREGR